MKENNGEVKNYLSRRTSEAKVDNIKGLVIDSSSRIYINNSFKNVKKREKLLHPLYSTHVTLLFSILKLSYNEKNYKRIYSANKKYEQ